MKKIGIIALIISLVTICSCKTVENDVVAYVDGEKIETREFIMIASRKKAEVVGYFAGKYACEYADSFWNTNFNGEIPSEMLKEKVMEELLPLKIQQKLAVEYDLMKSCNYSDFLIRLNKENTERKRKKEKSDIVYGVSEYSEETFYFDENAKMIIALKDLWEDEQDIKEEELKKYYEAIKEDYYKELPSGVLTMYIFDFGKEATAAEIMNKAKKGDDIDGIVKNAGGRIETLSLDSQSSQRVYDMEYPELLNSLTNGEKIAGIFESFDGIYFAQLNEAGGNKYKAFEDVKGNVEDMYFNKIYNDYINKLTDEADIRFTEKYNELDFSQI